MLGGGKNIYEIYFEYEGKRYEFQYINEYILSLESFEYLKDSYMTIGEYGVRESDVKLGQYVNYDGKNWIVIYDDDKNGLQMVSEKVLGESIELGKNDPYIEYAVQETLQKKDLNEDGIIENLNIDSNFSEVSEEERAVFSYNNIVKTLNQICKNLVTPKPGVIKEVRSIGSNPKNPNSDSEKMYTSDNLKIWPTIDSGEVYEPGTFNGLLKEGPGASDGARLSSFNTYISGCWVASRQVSVSRVGGIKFCANSIYTPINGTPTQRTDELFRVDETYVMACTISGHKVRPVIMLEDGALDNLEGLGTVDSPYLLK